MFQFIVTNILMVSLGVVLYVMVRTLPRIEEETAAENKSFLDRWVASEIPEKIDKALNSFLVKFLRKSKVLLLKIDNALGRHLQKIKPEGANGKDQQKPAIDFQEITSKNKDGNNGTGAPGQT